MKKLMAANWKMYKKRSEAKDMVQALVKNLSALPTDHEVVIFAPFTCFAECAEGLLGSNHIYLGAQNVYPDKEGAYTGEISPLMLLDASCRFVLTGHSERRQILGESNEFVGRKTSYALNSGLDVVMCIGETLEEREGGRLCDVLSEQLATGLGNVPDNFNPIRLSIAYEPIWAIGTGKVAGPAEITETHGLVRKLLAQRFSDKANKMRILYGGSVKPDNAPQIMTLDNVDGVLVGGASLQAESFTQIVLS